MYRRGTRPGGVQNPYVCCKAKRQRSPELLWVRGGVGRWGGWAQSPPPSLSPIAPLYPLPPPLPPPLCELRTRSRRLPRERRKIGTQNELKSGAKRCRVRWLCYPIEKNQPLVSPSGREQPLLRVHAVGGGGGGCQGGPPPLLIHPRFWLSPSKPPLPPQVWG